MTNQLTIMDEAKLLILLNEARNKMWKQDDELKLLRARTNMFDDVIKILYSRTPGGESISMSSEESLEMRITHEIDAFNARLNKKEEVEIESPMHMAMTTEDQKIQDDTRKN